MINIFIEHGKLKKIWIQSIEEEGKTLTEFDNETQHIDVECIKSRIGEKVNVTEFEHETVEVLKDIICQNGVNVLVLQPTI